MGLSALRSVGDAIDATREFMLPTSVGRWAKLSLIALFLGAPGTPIPANPQFADPTFWEGPQAPPGAGPGGDQPAPDPNLVEVLGFQPLDPGTWPPWLVGVAVSIVALGILYVYLGVLLRFVLVESLREDAVRLRRHARPHLRGAIGVFGLRAIFALVTAAAGLVLVLALAPVAPGDLPWLPDLAVLQVDGLAAVALAIGAMVVLLLVWLVDVVTLQFVVPTMIAEGGGVLAGWRRFWPTLRAAWREYAAFAVVRLVLGTAVGIAALLGLLLAVALALVPLGTVAAAVVLLAGGLGSLGSTAVAILLALLAVLVLYAVVAFAAIAAPLQVYLWTYALLVLGDTDAELDLVAEYREAARAEDRLGSA